MSDFLELGVRNCRAGLGRGFGRNRQACGRGNGFRNGNGNGKIRFFNSDASSEAQRAEFVKTSLQNRQKALKAELAYVTEILDENDFTMHLIHPQGE